MQNLIGDMLRGFGARSVTGARDAGSAWVEIEARTFDFLIIDWMLEPIDGCQLIRKIRESRNRRVEMVPIIMITGHSEQFRVEAARDAGTNEFLTLPLAPIVLFDRIVSLIDRPRPFIRTKTFFGPDRRRRRESGYIGPYRRSNDRPATLNEPVPDLTATVTAAEPADQPAAVG